MLENHQLEIITTTKLLHKTPRLCEEWIAATQAIPFADSFSRLLLWLEYFNETFHSKQCVHYHFTIEALFSVWTGKNVLLEQTFHEFELSKEFYESFFATAIGTVFLDSATARKLLVLSFVFSKYYGMIRSSLLPQFKNLDQFIRPEDMDNIFIKSFVKYETPGFLIRNFQEMTTVEMQLLMELIQGKNLRSHVLFPNALTKKEFAQLGALNTNRILYSDKIVLRGAIIVKLTNGEFNEHFLDVFLQSSATFKMYPERYFQDIDYWRKGYYLTLDGLHGLQNGSITDCVDFLESKKYHTDEPFSLNGRTTASFLRLVADWHGQVHQIDFKQFIGEIWEKSSAKDFHFTIDNVRYCCIELHSGLMLDNEGKSLNHCVITYTPLCKKRYCTIWSLRRWSIEKNGFESLLTLEVSDNTIVQARGNENRLPTSAEKLIIKDWAERMGYFVELIKNQ